MKFGARLKSDLYPEWESKYIDYSGLKKQLKKRNVDADGENAQWDDALEEDFKAHLKQELDKVKAFEESQSDQIMSHLAAYQTKVQDLMDRQDAHHSARDHDGDGDEEEDDESAFDDGIEQEFVDLEQDLETLIWETHEISKFASINFTGFTKITKKHDVGDSLTLADSS